MSVLSPEIMRRLIEPGARLPWLVNWLTSEVWSDERFSALSPEEYLSQGEKHVHSVEELLASAAGRVYDELATAAKAVKSLTETLVDGTSVVVFDGASIREAPLFRQKARESGFDVVENGVTYGALPSETVDFVEQRIIGKRVAPKQLPPRTELKERGIKAFYFPDAIASQSITAENGSSFLFWSAFPDVTYKNSDARFARHFSDMQALYDAAWKNTVMQVPRGRRIVVTSDHGYIFFGAGFESTRPSDACTVLDQDRNKRFTEHEAMPSHEGNPDLQIFPDERLAMVRGRLKNRPRGPSANLVYRHGGLSLMEMVVPWIVLERK
ncbi:MAG: hypothetical protein E4H02_10110 [Lentisphaerales bacterium]|nr:MAG: hypothetical protein E4H02_10110 [Lentisphaerales bacterium]